VSVGTGPAYPAAAGPIIEKKEFLCLHYVNFCERKMNPDRFFFIAIVGFCNLQLILLSAEPLWGEVSSL